MTTTNRAERNPWENPNSPIPESLLKWIYSLKGEAQAYALDYLSYWVERKPEPDVDRYGTDDDYSQFNAGRAREIAGKIRSTLKGY